MKMPGKCTGPKLLSKKFRKMGICLWKVMTWSEEWTGRERF